jgi:ABC-type proline/glycine betaine transport system permease subunit
VPSPGVRSIKRNADPIHRSSYYAAFTKVIKTLRIEILKYIKLIAINNFNTWNALFSTLLILLTLPYFDLWF